MNISETVFATFVVLVIAALLMTFSFALGQDSRCDRLYDRSRNTADSALVSGVCKGVAT